MLEKHTAGGSGYIAERSLYVETKCFSDFQTSSCSHWDKRTLRYIIVVCSMGAGMVALNTSSVLGIHGGTIPKRPRDFQGSKEACVFRGYNGEC